MVEGIKIKILGTGLSGLIGTRITELLADKYRFQDLSLETGVDITDKGLVEKLIKQSDARIILHMAAVTDVDGCEEEVQSSKLKVQNNNGMCWKVNVEGTRNIVEAADKYGKKLIYASTEFVFDGEAEFYNENSKPNPINWYGTTKYEAEHVIKNTLDNYIITRFAFPYRAKFEREDIVRFFLNKLKRKEKVKAIYNWIITPTFIDDIAQALDILIQSNRNGLYHIVGSSSHTPFEIANLVAEVFKLDKSLIDAVKLEDIFAGKAKRPRRLVVENDKISKLGMKMRTLEEGLQEVKQQL
jgi:dTDP-4-dehydrorhamnose reductase